MDSPDERSNAAGDSGDAGVRPTQPEGTSAPAASARSADPLSGTPDGSDGDTAETPSDTVETSPGTAKTSPGTAKTSPGTATAVSSKNAKPARWWELPLLVAVAVLVAVLVKTFLFQPFYIPSESMEKTLHGCVGCAGDKILVNKPIYHFRDPEPGDIIVFHAPSGWEEPVIKPATNAITGPLRAFGQLIGVVPPDETDLVKRVIATGGQGVRCCSADGHVQVSPNGIKGPWRSLAETYVFEVDHKKFGPILVPKGRLWVMGDHRGSSADSRYHCGPGPVCDPVLSTVANSAVIGKAFVIAWPPKRWRTLGTPATFAKASGTAASMAPFGVALWVFPLRRWRRRRPPR